MTRSSLKPTAIYKIIPKSNLDTANKFDCVKLLELDIKSGFIHTAYGKQVKGIIDKFFPKENSILLLELDVDQLKENGTVVKPEANKEGGTVFPHLYGVQRIPINAVKKVIKKEIVF